MRVIEQQELGFFVEIRPRPEGVRVVVDGELDLVTASHLEAALDRVVAENGQPTIFLDLSAVEFLDAAGWRVVDNAALALGDRGGRLIVAEVSDPVRRFMQIVGDDTADLGSDGTDGSVSLSAGGR